MSTSNCLHIFSIKGSFIKLFSKNNTLIELSLSKISRKLTKTVKNKVEKLIKDVSNQDFKTSLIHIFMNFSEFLSEVEKLSPESI